jgi:phosphatidylserine/phosphatidylglycerophosphate/cardiolipin synthase-like enzyme
LGTGPLFLSLCGDRNGRITLSIAPDNSFDTLVNFIASAQQTITIESMTFEHVGIADALVAASQRGVSVTCCWTARPLAATPIRAATFASK